MGNILQQKSPPPPPPFPVEDWPWIWAIENPEYLDWKLSCYDGVGDDDDSSSKQAAANAAIQARVKEQAKLPVLISSTTSSSPLIYLSDARHAHQIDLLLERGITHVLNVAGKAGQIKDLDAYKNAGIINHTIHGEDEEGYPMMKKHWNECIQFIESASSTSSSSSSNRCRIVIHCAAGLNRSGLFVTAYKLYKERCNVLDAVAHARYQRGNLVLCNKSFITQLVAYARQENLLGPKPGESNCRVQQKSPLFHDSYYENYYTTTTTTTTNSSNQKNNIKHLFNSL